MAINLTYLNESNTLGDVVGGLNTTSGGLVAGAILIILSLIFVAGFRTITDIKSSLIASGAIVGLISVFMWAADYIPMGYVFIPIVFLFAGLIMIAFE